MSGRLLTREAYCQRVPSWFHFRTPPKPPEDPSVALVEAILQAAASGSHQAVPHREGRLVVTHAVWLCACETPEDSPLWLIYAVGDDDVGWQRINEHRLHIADVVQAEHLTGGHPAPDEVLAWLRGNQHGPGGGLRDFPEDAFIYDELLRRIRQH